jgi:hypothetical protein
MDTLGSLYNIAQQNNDSRSVRLGYNASVSYITDQLDKYTDLQYWLQPFTVPFYAELSPSRLMQIDPTEVEFVYGGMWIKQWLMVDSWLMVDG